MSLLGKKWIIKNNNSEISPLEKILINRGFLTKEQQNDFLSFDEKKFHDPFLFDDMEKAVSRIEKAIKANERIIVFGDYDVDGISGSAVLIHTFNKLGANVSYRLPNRLEDGYGLSEKFIDEFIEKNVKLLITVDCGISCHREIDKAASNGIDTIITDHHTIPEKPHDHAIAILHPKHSDKYPFKELTGAGVALKLAQAMIKRFLPKQEQQEFFSSLIDLATLGTVADLGPLKGENRLIVKKGLENLGTTTWIGLKQILELSDSHKYSIDTSTIGFRIAPRINAAGRIDNPYIALSLLLQETKNEKVEKLGQKLESLNKKRQEMTEKALEETKEVIEKETTLPFIFIAANKNWHVGILGLIAGKLVEKYARPAIIMQDFGDTLVASARSPEYFNIIKAITRFSDHLITFGGHAQAAGFNIKKENYEKFKKEISTYTKKKLKNKELKPILEIDCELTENDLNFDFIKEMEQLKPFGVENSKPVFLLNSVTPQFITQVGKDRSHLKFSLTVKGKTINVIAFRMGDFADKIRKHRKIDLAFNLEKNHWRNKDYLQLRAIDFRTNIN